MKLIKYKNICYEEYWGARVESEYDAYLFGFIKLYHWAYGEKEYILKNFILSTLWKIRSLFRRDNYNGRKKSN